MFFCDFVIWDVTFGVKFFMLLREVVKYYIETCPFQLVVRSNYVIRRQFLLLVVFPNYFKLFSTHFLKLGKLRWSFFVIIAFFLQKTRFIRVFKIYGKLFGWIWFFYFISQLYEDRITIDLRAKSKVSPGKTCPRGFISTYLKASDSCIIWDILMLKESRVYGAFGSGKAKSWW